MFRGRTGLAGDFIHVAPGTIPVQVFITVPVQHRGNGVWTLDDTVLCIFIVS